MQVLQVKCEQQAVAACHMQCLQRTAQQEREGALRFGAGQPAAPASFQAPLRPRPPLVSAASPFRPGAPAGHWPPPTAARSAAGAPSHCGQAAGAAGGAVTYRGAHGPGFTPSFLFFRATALLENLLPQLCFAKGRDGDGATAWEHGAARTAQIARSALVACLNRSTSLSSSAATARYSTQANTIAM